MQLRLDQRVPWSRKGLRVQGPQSEPLTIKEKKHTKTPETKNMAAERDLHDASRENVRRRDP